MAIPLDKEAYQYAERIRARIPRVLQAAREAMPVTKYTLAKRSGITREMIGRIEAGKAVPGPCVLAQICHTLGLTLSEFVRRLEDDAKGPP
jgi:transcriptional regulator with XRE-family HTH domain